VTLTIPKRFLNTKEAAEYCGYKKPTFDKYRLTGEGPIFCKTSRNIAYDINALNEWMLAHKCASTSEVRSNELL
jgi:predicted DNA-binding transcriptional regulator AlpA